MEKAILFKTEDKYELYYYKDFSTDFILIKGNSLEDIFSNKVIVKLALEYL